MSQEKNLTPRQRSEAAAQAKEARKWKMYGVIAIIVAVLIAALLFWDAGFIQKRATALTIGDRNYTVADVDYYYNVQYNSVSAYATYYGLDTSVSLKEQEAYDGTTWYDYLLDSAVSSLKNVSLLAQEGEKEGYTISDDAQLNIDNALEDVKNEAKDNNVSVSYYLHRMYGRFMTYSRYEKLITEYYYAYDYQSHKTDSFEVTEDEMEDYYQENKDTMDEFDYVCYLVNADAESTTDEDGNEVDPTEEEIAAAAEEAKANAKKIQEALKSGDESKVASLVEKYGATDYSSTSPASFSNLSFGSWLTNSKREANDTSVIEYTTTSDDEETIEGYYVLQFYSRNRKDYNAATIRNILVAAEEDTEDEESEETTYKWDEAEAEAESIQQTWQDNGGTEEAFAELTEENSDDSSTYYNGGKRTNIAKGSLDSAVDSWLYDEERQEGDYTILKDETNTGYQLLYFVGYDDLLYWQKTAKNALQSDAYSDWYEEVEENYEETQTWFYSQVG
jgi:hypothetical protein